jgi:hypothetical protein
VSQLATRLQEWADFLGQLRLVLSEIDGVVRAVPGTVFQDSPTCDQAAWSGILVNVDRVEQEHLETLKDVLKTAQAIKAPSPVPKPGGDLTPDEVLAALLAMTSGVREAHGQGSAKHLRGACDLIKRSWQTPMRRCLSQIQYECRSLNNLVEEIKRQLL